MFSIHSYTYDAENRMLTVDGGAYTYKYDVDGRRVQKAFSGNTIENLYDLSGRMVTEFYNGGWNRGEIYAGGRHLATYVNSSTYFHHADWLGTERQNTDVNGNNNESCTSLSFGDGKNCTGLAVAWKLFTDLEHDGESDLDHTQFRQLNTRMGRWTSPDPYLGSMNLANPQSLNRYSYVLNNPVNALDPTGLNCVWDDGSFDSADDPKSGSSDHCADLGGTWIGNDVFAGLGLGDWSASPSSGLSSLVGNIQSCAAAVGGGRNALLLVADAFASSFSNEQTAYVLGTAAWETGPGGIGTRMTESGGKLGEAYFNKYNDILGNNSAGDGAKFKGRGYAQLTGKANYQHWSNELSVDLIQNPSLAATPDIAAQILVEGLDKGSFTGVSLYNYVNPDGSDFLNARRTVIGMDQASKISKIAQNYANTLGQCR